MLMASLLVVSICLIDCVVLHLLVLLGVILNCIVILIIIWLTHSILNLSFWNCILMFLRIKVMKFKRFLRAYKICLRTQKTMYFYAKNDNEFRRIVRYVRKGSFCPITVYHPYSLSFTTFSDSDDDDYDPDFECMGD